MDRTSRRLPELAQSVVLPLAAAVLIGLALPAHATLITVTGGFTGFSGTAGGGGFESTINGQVVCPTAGCDVERGAASVGFGSPVSSVSFSDTDFGSPETPNFVSFTPAAQQNVVLGQEFLLGTFTYSNGDWFGDATFGFSLTTVVHDALPLPADLFLDGHQFLDALVVRVTTGAQPTPEAAADFIDFAGRPDLGSFRVYELSNSPIGTNTGTIDFYGRIGSLIPTRFANPAGGFLDSSVDLVPSGQPPGGPVVPVPEPNVLPLLALGIPALVAGVRRRIGQSRH